MLIAKFSSLFLIFADSQNKVDKDLMIEKINFLSEISRHDNVVAILGKVSGDPIVGEWYK